MKKVVVLSLMSLLFLATLAQRPSKSRSTEENENDRNKSEMTTNRSNENTSNSNQRPDNINNNRPSTIDRNEDRSDNESNTWSDMSRDNDGPDGDIRTERKHYNTPDRNRAHHEVYAGHRPKPVEYRKPYNVNVVWSQRMYYEYMGIYPEYHYWYYPNGYRIRTISAYDAIYYTGEVVNVYGRIYETWYSRKTDEYILYFGASYPYHDFSVVIRGNKARQFSRRPEIFFEGRYIWVTGLISLHHGQPEMIVMKKHQIHLY